MKIRTAKGYPTWPLLVLAFAAGIILGFAQTSDGRSANPLRPEVRELRATNACLRKQVGWQAGQADAYRSAWYRLDGSDLPESYVTASGILNVKLNHYGFQPRCAF